MGKNFHDVRNTKRMLKHGVAVGMGAFRKKPVKKVDILQSIKPAPTGGGDKT